MKLECYLLDKEYGHFQAFQPKISISQNKSNENFDNYVEEYGVSLNDIIKKEKQDQNENETKQKEKEKEKVKKEKSPKNSSVYFQTRLSDQKKESKKMLKIIYLNMLISHIAEKMVGRY
jgi:hypothetical protein